MTHDLSTLLQRAAPTPSTPVDVDAVVARGRQLQRRATVATTAAALLVVVAATGVIGTLLRQPNAPVVDQEPSETLPSPVPGTHADGALVVGEPGAVPSLDMGVDARLDGRELVHLDVPADEVAVAGDGAIGTFQLQGAMLRIHRDGRVVHEVPVAPMLGELARQDPTVDDWPNTVDELAARQPSLAFDEAGTLWLSISGPGGAVIGLHRDGNRTATAAFQQPDGQQHLRVAGDAISLVDYDDADYGEVSTTAEVLPLEGGQDPMAGTHPVPVAADAGATQFGTAIDRRAVTMASLIGGGRVALEGAATQEELEGEGSFRMSWLPASAQVASTEAILVHQTGFPAAVLMVLRSDGTVAGGLLDPSVLGGGIDASLAVGADGAIHLARPGADGGTDVRTLLGPDLLPPAAADEVASTPYELSIRDPWRHEGGAPSQRPDEAVRDEVPMALAAVPAEARVPGTGPPLSAGGGRTWRLGPSGPVLAPLAPDCGGGVLCAGQYSEWLLVDAAGEILVAHAFPGRWGAASFATTEDGALVGHMAGHGGTLDTAVFRLGTRPGDRTVRVFPGPNSFLLEHVVPAGSAATAALPAGWTVEPAGTPLPAVLRADGFSPSAAQLEALLTEGDG